tara:strand:+ start:1169 stop:1606 length:438 start_codon:yes stop_codon:yes gene_type:complete
VFTRFRVEDQTIFDAFLLRELISRFEHDGLVCFVADVEKSGAFPSGQNLESVSRTASYKVGDRVSARWMSFSYVYRFLDRKGRKGEADIILSLIPDMHNWRSRFGKKRIGVVCEAIRPALEPISHFYGCRPRSDPREIVIRGRRK